LPAFVSDTVANLPPAILLSDALQPSNATPHALVDRAAVFPLFATLESILLRYHAALNHTYVRSASTGVIVIPSCGNVAGTAVLQDEYQVKSRD